MTVIICVKFMRCILIRKRMCLSTTLRTNYLVTSFISSPCILCVLDYMSSLLSFRLFIFLSEVIYLFISEYYTITIIVLSIYTSKKENSKGEVILFTRAPIHSFGRRGELSIIRGLKDNSN